MISPFFQFEDLRSHVKHHAKNRIKRRINSNIRKRIKNRFTNCFHMEMKISEDISEEINTAVNQRVRSDDHYTATIRCVSIVSMVGNLLLAGFKFFAGFVGRSDAMISDAIHSSSDIAGSFIVLIGAGISGKAADAEHPYGHERFECVASILLSFILFLAGVGLIREGLLKIVSGSYKSAASPGFIALVAAICSIIVKEAMYWYTMSHAKRISSESLRAEAWHHRSDALSSIGSLIGIAGARMGFRILDPLAGILISLFILKAAVSIFREAIDKLTDHACSPELEEQIRECVMKDPRVVDIDLLRTREFGRKIYLDLEIKLERTLSLEQAHRIAEEVHDRIEEAFPEIKHVMIHVNPA